MSRVWQSCRRNGGHVIIAAGLSTPLTAQSAWQDRVNTLFMARMQQAGIPGAQLAVVQNGEVVASLTYGVADSAGRVAVSDTTRFRIGSVSKLFTATAAARLRSRGALDIDAPVGRMVPEFTGGPAATARQLGGHLAGVRHYVPRDFARPTRAYRDVIDALSIFAADTLFSVPGTRYFYSSYGYNLLGAVIARAAREDFRQHVARSVLKPLGLRRTMFERADSNVAGLSRGFDPDTSGKWRVGARTDLSDRWPSGGMLSSANDLAIFADASVRGPFLSASERELLFTSMRTTDGVETGVGFGWRVAKDSSGRTVYHHGGAVQGGRAMVMVWRDHRLALAITTNLSPGARQVTERDAMALGSLYLP